MTGEVRKFEIVIETSGDQAKDLEAFRRTCRKREVECFGTAFLTVSPGQAQLDVREKFQLAAQILNELRDDSLQTRDSHDACVHTQSPAPQRPRLAPGGGQEG